MIGDTPLPQFRPRAALIIAIHASRPPSTRRSQPMPLHPTSHASWFRSALLCVAVALSACSGNTPQSLIASGRQFVEKKDIPAAVIQFKAALQMDPTSQEARILLGEALISSDIDGAILELTKVLNDNAPRERVLPTLSRAMVLAGDFKKLVSTYGDVSLTDRPAQAALKANIASAWGALGDRARTEAAVKASLAAVPDYGPAQILRARMLAGEGRFDQAAEVVDAALARNDQFYEAWLLRGEILDFAKSDFKGAEESYRKALVIENSYVVAHAAIISSHLRRHDMAGAKAQVEKLRAVLPRHPYTTLVDGQIAYLDRQYLRAREYVQLLLRVAPDHKGALLLGGAVEAQLGSVVQAAAYLNKILLMSPGMDAARRNLAEVEIRLGQYAKALETLKPLLNGPAPWVDALALAGDAEMRLGHADVAERYYVQAAKLDPANARFSAAAAMARLSSGDVLTALSDLEQLSSKSNDTYVDEAIFAARMKRREYAAALATLDTMIKKEPGKASHIEMRGRVHVARRDLKSARMAFEEALKADPAMFSAVSSLAAIDLMEGKTPQAIERLRASVKANPKSPVALIALADLLSRNDGSPEEIRKLYADAIIATPTVAEPRLRLIDFALRRRQFKEALQVAQEGLAAMPWDVQILDAAGQAQMRAGDIEQAATTFRKLATALPTSPSPYLRLAELYMASGKRDQAESAINKALDIAPDYEPAQVALLDLIMSSAGQQDPLERIRRITKSNPKQSLGYLLEAEYQIRRKDLDAAIAVLREGLVNTNRPEMAGKLYNVFLRSGRVAEAERFGAAWLKQHPKDVGFEYFVAAADMARGDLRLAEQRLRRVIAVYPNHVLALNNLANVLVMNGGKGAVDFAQRAVDRVPDSPALLDTLALALAAEKQPGLALDVQKRAVELAPKDDRLRYALAKVALQAGEKDLARQELKRLQDLGSAFPAQAEVGRLLQGL